MPAAALVLLLVATLWLWTANRAPLVREPVALMTSLPIYWGDGADVAQIAAGGSEVSWVRETLEQGYELRPLDALSRDGGTDPMAGIDRLLVVQPRGLSPQDNVALDRWVNAGGHLLLVLDPFLTGQYSVPQSDPDHPVTVGLVPPVVARWGMGLRFDDSQSLEVREVDALGIALPVAMAGEVHAFDGGANACRIAASGIMAICTVGKGRVTLLADAALFEFAQDDDGHRDALMQLAKRAFD